MASRLSSALLFLLLCLILRPNAKAQSSLFLPFGTAKPEVISYLETRDYVRSLEVDDELSVVRITLAPRKRVEYAFFRNRLYAVTVLQNYTSPVEADQAEEHLMEYLRSTGAPQIQQTGRGAIVCHTAITDSRVMKVFTRTHPDSRSLILSSISLAHGPEMTEEDMFYEKRLFDLDNTYVLDGN